MTPRGRRASTARLVALLILLVVAIFALYRLFYALPAAPPPEIRQGRAFVPGHTWAAIATAGPAGELRRRG